MSKVTELIKEMAEIIVDDLGSAVRIKKGSISMQPVEREVGIMSPYIEEAIPEDFDVDQSYFNDYFKEEKNRGFDPKIHGDELVKEINALLKKTRRLPTVTMTEVVGKKGVGKRAQVYHAVVSVEIGSVTLTLGRWNVEFNHDQREFEYEVDTEVYDDY